MTQILTGENSRLVDFTHARMGDFCFAQAAHQCQHGSRQKKQKHKREEELEVCDLHVCGVSMSLAIVEELLLAHA